MKDASVLKWIYINCGKRAKEITVLILLNGAAAFCVTLFAVLSKSVMDSAQKGEREELLRYIALLLITICLQIAIRIISSFIQAVSDGKAEIHLKSMVFSHLINGEYAESTERHSGDLMTRLTTDVSLVSQTYVSLLPNSVTYIVRMLSAAIALYVMDKRFAGIILLGGAAVLAVVGISKKHIKNLHRLVQEKDAKVRAFMQEMLENLFAIKVFGIEEKIIKSSLQKQKDFYHQKVKKRVFSITAGFGFSIAFAIGFLLATAYGSYGVLKGTMTFGTVVAIIQLVNQIQSPVVGVTHVIPTFFAMITSAQRLIEITDSKKEKIQVTDVEYEDFTEIRVENATFGYNKEKIIREADFSIKKGEFVGIKGHSGSGKTTVFKIISGLYPLDSGKAVIGTKDGEIDCRKVKNLFSFVPQDNMLFSGTVRENITILNPDATEEEIRNALENSAAEFAYDLDGGLDFVLGESGAGISQGQAQRLAIARALLGKGKVLLMDEATSALDSESEKRVMKKLKENDEITVVFITHREMVLEDCDRTITVENGTVTEN